jgi:hypothetical protein
MRNELTSPASGDEIDDAEEIGDDVLAVGLAAVTARSTVAPHGGRWTTCRSSVVAGNTPPPGGRNASSRARPVARVATAYVTAVRTTAASRCRRIAWHEVAGSTPRL